MEESLQRERTEVGAKEASNSSQDSLSSTGSNRELTNQLDSTIAQVEAFAKEIIEKRKQSTVSLTPALEGGKSGERSEGPPGEARQQRSVSIGGARPRLSVQEHSQASSSRPTGAGGAKGGGGGGIMLRESSWGSRDQALNLPSSSQPSPSFPLASKGGGANVASFAKNRNLWEKRSVQEEDLGEGGGVAVAGSLSARGGAFRSKDFWAQRTSAASGSSRQRQTPDLVLGLPISQQIQQQQQAEAAAKTSPKSDQAAPVPKPRTLAAGATSGASTPSSPDEPPQAKTKSNASRRRSPPKRSVSREESESSPPPPPTQPRVSAAAAAMALRHTRPNPLEATNAASSRPQVRVKPQVQARRSPQESEGKEEGK